jgi:hypothetical protein
MALRASHLMATTVHYALSATAAAASSNGCYATAPTTITTKPGPPHGNNGLTRYTLGVPRPAQRLPYKPLVGNESLLTTHSSGDAESGPFTMCSDARAVINEPSL